MRESLEPHRRPVVLAHDQRGSGTAARLNMAESTNTYVSGKGSITLETMNDLPGADGKTHYGPIDPAALGRASLYTSIKVIAVGDAPVSGDYGQGLPSGQTFTDTSADNLRTTVLVDTGSYETVLPRSILDGILTDEQLSKYPAASISYSSSGNAGTGVWVPMKIALTTVDGSTAVTTIPVIIPTDGTKFWMMGVGFNIGRGAPASLPDTSTYGNAFLNIGQMADGSVSRGYVIDGSGIHLGLDTADVGQGWAFQKLQPSARTAPAGAPPDWQPATIAGTLEYPAAEAGKPGAVGEVPPGNLLMDTGVSKSFVKTTDGLPAATNGTKASFNLFGTDGEVGYRYTLGAGDAQAPTSDGQALSTGQSQPGAGTFVNTGQHFLSGFDYLYDADNGYLGVRPNAAASSNLRFAKLLSASGSYAMPDGFAATVPLYLAGDTRLTVPGTATLSGGVEGRGTLTLADGTLVLGAGTTLKAPEGLILSSLDADGSAVVDVPAGKVVQVAAGFTAGPDSVTQGVLTVTGGGTLQVGSVSVASGHSIPEAAASGPLPPDTGAGLGAFAAAVATKVAATGERAYSYHTIGKGADSAPDVDPAWGSAFTDCSGWVSFALNSVSPLHEAVAAAHRTQDKFNQGTVETAGGGSVTLAEATAWGWARAEVLTDLFKNADGANGFAKVANFADLRAGDMIAYALGIYSDPTGDINTNPGLVKKGDTGHTMVVAGTPVRVTDPAELAKHANLSADVAAVYAVPVVDSSDKRHFKSPQDDTRNYDALPADDPRTGPNGDQGGGVGTGTMWFAVNAAGEPVQFCLGASDGWQPPSSGEASSIAAVRLTDTIDLGQTDLQDGKLVVRVYPKASPTLDGVDYAVSEHLTGAGGLDVTGGGTLSLGAGNAFTGSVEVEDGTTLAIGSDDALGAAGNRLALDGGATLRITAPLTFDHAVSVAKGTAVLDLAGNLVRISGALSVAAGATLEVASGSAGGELKLNDDVQPTGTVLVDGGAALTLTSTGGVPGTIALRNGATLNVHASSILPHLLVSGKASLAVADGTTLTVKATGSVPRDGSVGTLLVSGGGTLQVGTGTKLLAHNTLYTGTLDQFNGQALAGFKPGDVIDVAGLVVPTGQAGVANGVTAKYDDATGLLTIGRNGATATVQLAPRLKLGANSTPEAFTVRTDGFGGTLVQLVPATGQGASDALGATALRATKGTNGLGVTVGVISVSGNALGGLAQDIANGFLPKDTTVLSDPSGISSDEGRAMAQMVHEIAPGAAIRLAYATGAGNGQDLADAIDRLVQGPNGAKVIVDDISVFADRVYQGGGPVAKAISDATAQGVTFVTSAANVGANYYEHALSLGRTTLPGIDGAVWAYDFGQGTGQFFEKLSFTGNGSGNVDLTLGWTQPGVSPAYQLRMAVFTRNADGTYAKTADVPYAQAQGNGATLNIGIGGSQHGGTYYVAVYAKAPITLADQSFKLIVHHEGDTAVFSDPNANQGSGAIYGHALDPNEITVGAVDYANAKGTPPKNETFSASGPTAGSSHYLLNADGSAPDTTPIAKPDVSGVDGVHNDVSGVDAPFYGTSAAAPTVAAVAALMLQANPDLTPAEVKAMLKQSALPTNSAEQGGAGLVQAEKAVALATADAARPRLAFTDTSTGGQGTAKMDTAAAGAPGYLKWQYIATGSNSMTLATQASNVFIHGGSGDDAIAVPERHRRRCRVQLHGRRHGQRHLLHRCPHRRGGVEHHQQLPRRRCGHTLGLRPGGEQLLLGGRARRGGRLQGGHAARQHRRRFRPRGRRGRRQHHLRRHERGPGEAHGAHHRRHLRRDRQVSLHPQSRGLMQPLCPGGAGCAGARSSPWLRCSRLVRFGRVVGSVVERGVPRRPGPRGQDAAPSEQQEQRGGSEQQEGPERLVGQDACHAAGQERRHGLAVQAELVFVEGDLLLAPAPARKVDQVAQLDADVGDHPRDVRRPHAGVRDPGHDRVLQAHQETQPEGQRGATSHPRHPQVRAPQCGQQERLGEDAEGVDAGQPPAPAGVDQKGGDDRARDEGRHEGEVKGGVGQVADSEAVGERGHVARHVGGVQAHGVEAGRVQRARNPGEGPGKAPVCLAAARFPLLDEHRASLRRPIHAAKRMERHKGLL